MQRQLIQSAFLLIGLVLTLSACFNEPDYSETPAISFKSVVPYTIEAGGGVGQGRRDSVVVTISFQDGDGDLGEDINDTTRIRRMFADETWGNYELKTFQLINGRFVELNLSANNKLYFPRLTREGQKGAIEGTLDFSQKFFYQTGQSGFRIVPLKFQIRVRDRAFNVSNVIETDTVRVPVGNR
ncbi:MAG: hypothetical protein H7Z72_19050 [Bacteroidetes bacterium]|nr:hypothetical protein [Fibrella sp.]